MLQIFFKPFVYVMVIASALSAAAQPACEDLFKKVEASRVPVNEAGWRPPQSTPYDGRLNSEVLKSQGFHVDESGQLIDSNSNLVIGRLLVFDLKHIYRWSSSAANSKIRATGRVDDETMSRILLSGGKGLQMGPGYYFSAHPSDSSEYGRDRLSFDLKRSAMVLQARFGTPSRWSDDVVFRLARVGIDAVTVEHYHTGIWFSLIRNELLNSPRTD